MADVLIIDDDTAAAAAMAALLRREGIGAACATDAAQALTFLHAREPSLVLLDLSMPRTDGLDLLDAIRDDPRFADLRVAVFSGRTDPASVRAAERLGACDFHRKGQRLDVHVRPHPRPTPGRPGRRRRARMTVPPPTPPPAGFADGNLERFPVAVA